MTTSSQRSDEVYEGVILMVHRLVISPVPSGVKFISHIFFLLSNAYIDPLPTPLCL